MAVCKEKSELHTDRVEGKGGRTVRDVGARLHVEKWAGGRRNKGLERE